MDWRKFHGGRRQRGNGRCGLDSIKKVFSGVEGEEDGENSNRQDDEKHTEEQPGNEKFPRPIGTEGEANAETEWYQGEQNRETPVVENPKGTAEKY